MHAWLEVVAAGNSLQSCTARCTVSKSSPPPAPRQFCMHVGGENSLLDWDESLAFFGGAFLGGACIVALERKHLKHAASDSASKPSPSTDAIGICFDMCLPWHPDQMLSSDAVQFQSIESRSKVSCQDSPNATALPTASRSRAPKGPSILLVQLDTNQYNAQLHMLHFAFPSIRARHILWQFLDSEHSTFISWSLGGDSELRCGEKRN